MTHSKPRSFFLIRHGETVWNTEKRFQGHLDSPLTERGVEQAHLAGKQLRSLVDWDNVSGFYASPLGRAATTAEIIQREVKQPTLEIQKSELLKELDFGDWRGLTQEEIELQSPGEFEKREVNKWEYRCPEGESYADVATRVDTWLATLPDSGTYIVVAHGMINRVLRGRLLGLSTTSILEYFQANGDIISITNGIEQ